MPRIPQKASPVAFVTILGIFLGLTAWATDYCPTLLDRLRGYDKVAQFQTMVDRRSFKRYYGLEETRPIVESIAQLKAIRFHHPFELTGRATEKDGVLTVFLDGIGPPVGTQPSVHISKSQMKGAMAGVPDFFRA